MSKQTVVRGTALFFLLLMMGTLVASLVGVPQGTIRIAINSVLVIEFIIVAILVIRVSKKGGY